MTKTVLSYQPLEDRGEARDRYALLALLCAAAAIAYVQRSAISVPATLMETEFKVDNVQFGKIMSAWLLGYALAQIPSGWLGDWWGSRNSLTLFALAWSALTGLVALTPGYVSLLVVWSLMGIAQAGMLPCAARAIRRAFPDSQRATATGMLGTAMGVGTVIAPLLAGPLLAKINWRWIFVLFALPGIGWALLFYWLRPGETTDAQLPRPGGTGPMTSPAPAWAVMLGSGSMWLLCAQQFLRGAAMVFFLTWFPTFLSVTRRVSVTRSGLLTALAGAGVVLGALLGGLASDGLLARTGNHRLSRQGIAVAGMTACAGLIVGAYFISNTTLAVSVIAAGAFCGAFGGVSGYTVAMDLGGSRVSTVFSVMNMCGNVGAAAFPVAIGWLVKHTGNWDKVLFIFAGMFAVDAICWALLNPKKALFEEG
jgi:MFS transporter, ACS family, D-galactonate transporter